MSTEQTTTGTNGHATGRAPRAASTVRWLPAADLPDSLAGAVVPDDAADVDEAPIWGAEGMPNPDALEKAVDRAKRTVALQSSPELTEAKSPADLAEDIASRRRIRSTERLAEEEDAAAEVAERRAEIAHRHAMAEIERQHAAEVAKARTKAEQLANPWHQVVRIHRGLRWVPMLGVVPALFALVVGAVNVGAQLHRIFPDTPFISWVVDPMITLLLIAVGGAHLYGAARVDGKNVFRWVEFVGFALTSSAAVGLHYVPGPTPDAAASSGTGPLIWLAVPVCLGMSMWAAPVLRERMEHRLEEAHQKARKNAPHEGATEGSTEVLPTLSDLHGKNREEASPRAARKKGREEVTAVLAGPRRKTKADHRKSLAALVEAGEINPRDEGITNAVARRLGCRWGVADELLAEYRTAGER